MQSYDWMCIILDQGNSCPIAKEVIAKSARRLRNLLFSFKNEGHREKYAFFIYL